MSRPGKGSAKQELVTLKLAKVLKLLNTQSVNSSMKPSCSPLICSMVNIEDIFYQVVKKDLSPDWEDASIKLTDVEVTPSLSYLDFLWIMIKLLIRSNMFILLMFV